MNQTLHRTNVTIRPIIERTSLSFDISSLLLDCLRLSSYVRRPRMAMAAGAIRCCCR
jgi:hypothetical protein